MNEFLTDTLLLDPGILLADVLLTIELLLGMISGATAGFGVVSVLNLKVKNQRLRIVGGGLMLWALIIFTMQYWLYYRMYLFNLQSNITG